MELTNIIMNTKEQWFGFYKSLRDILRDGASKYTGMEAFNEINTLLILVFLEDKLENFDIEKIEMCKFKYIYDIFFTRIEKKIKDEKIKEPQLSQLMKSTKLELFKYLFDKRRNYDVQKQTSTTISFKKKEEIVDDIYFKHLPSVFAQIVKTSRLNRLFIRTKMTDADNAVDISTITGFIDAHSNDIYSLFKKIAETFYVKDKEGNLVAFAIVMPSFSKALQKAKGKLFPFGLFHLLNARNNSKDATFYLIGVHPEYQNKGVHAIIFKEYHTTFTEKGIQNCIRTPELIDNHAIHLLWKNFDPKIVCRRKTFRKEL